MREKYETQLRELHQELSNMGDMCEHAVALAIQAVTRREEALIRKVYEIDSTIDKQEREIENLCVKLLLKQQPVATDLRDISAALKMISDLERIGDQASDIAGLSVYIPEMPVPAMEDLKAMAKEAIKMVNDSIEAFVKRDLVLARQVISYDDVVDGLFTRIKQDLTAAIAQNPEQGEKWLDMLMVAKYLERIGDHATNIAEWVEYSILGKRSKDGVMEE